MRRAALALSALLSACGPSTAVLWHGHDATRAHRAVLEESDGQHRVVVDGTPHPRFDAVAFSHMRWSARGLVYPAQRGEVWHVVVAGVAGQGHRAIGDLVVQEGRVAYGAEDESGWAVVLDGEVGPRFHSLVPRSLHLGASRGPLVYAGRDDTGAHVVVGERVGPAFEDVSRLTVSAKARAIAYAGWTATGAQVVFGAERHGHYDEVHELRVAEAEPGWAAVVTQGARRWVVWDGRSLLAPADSRHLVIADDASHVAWVGGGGVFVDGRRVAEAADVGSIAIAPRTAAVLFVEREEDRQRLVADGRPGPWVRRVEQLEVSAAGHWGYVASRGVGRAVVVDGELRFRGEWAGSLRLAAAAPGYAFVARRAGRRFVVTPAGREEVPRPLVDTLELSPDGERWALVVADEAAHELRVLVDGEPHAVLDMDEVAARLLVEPRSTVAAVRAVVRGVLRSAE